MSSSKSDLSLVVGMLSFLWGGILRVVNIRLYRFVGTKCAYKFKYLLSLTGSNMENYGIITNPQYEAMASCLDDKVEKNPLSEIMDEKRELASQRVELLTEQLERRREVHEKIKYSIQYDEMFCRNKVVRQQGARNYEAAEKIELSQLMGLQRELRSENASYIRDTNRLNKDLMDAVIEFKEIVNRGEIFKKIK
jgi:hypothetical protein